MRTSRLSSALAMVGVLVAGGVAIAADDPTTASTDPFDVVIVVANDLEPRTISTSFVGDAVPTVTIDRDGNATLELDGDSGFAPLTVDLTQGDAFSRLTSDGTEQGSIRAAIQWSNPVGQETARIDVERLATDGDDVEDLGPFRVFVGFNLIGNVPSFTGTETGAKLALDDALPTDTFLKPGGTHDSGNTGTSSRNCVPSGCYLRVGVGFAPGKGVADLGAGRTITSRFVFTILDE